MVRSADCSKRTYCVNKMGRLLQKCRICRFCCAIETTARARTLCSIKCTSSREVHNLRYGTDRVAVCCKDSFLQLKLAAFMLNKPMWDHAA
jgi:hypothetical protein